MLLPWVIVFGVSIIVLSFIYGFYSKYAKVMLVLDMANEPELPKRFRIINHFPNMKIAGGGQFSQAAFALILKELHAERITVVDLRQESHGFLNGAAISWYGYHNAEHRGKSSIQIEAEQAGRLAILADGSQVKVNRITQKSAEGHVEKLTPIIMPVHDVISEEAWLAQLGNHYFRFYVQDYHAPTAHEADRFIDMVKRMPEHQWIYFHCRAGIGRTTVFMLMYDMMQHAKKETFNEILDRQVAIGGKDLRKLLPKSHYKYAWHAARLQFLKDFYEYARNNTDDFETPYSMWLANHESVA